MKILAHFPGNLSLDFQTDSDPVKPSQVASVAAKLIKKHALESFFSIENRPFSPTEVFGH